MVLAPKLLLLYKSLIFCVEIVYLLVGYTPSGDFVSLDNIHNILGIPVGLVTIYFYTMFNFVMNKVMAGNSKRFIGVILLLEFILFDCTRLFFIFLTGWLKATSFKWIIFKSNHNLRLVQARVCCSACPRS